MTGERCRIDLIDVVAKKEEKQAVHDGKTKKKKQK
jgi:ABC-type tungstate transport system permease subunit